MSSWGRNDQAVTANSTTTKETSNGAPIGTYALVKGGRSGTSATSFDANAKFGNTSPGSAANVDSNMFGNTTMSAFVNNMAVGVFGVSAKMANIVDSPLNTADVGYPGSGYFANATVTITAHAGSGGTINAQANSTGRISALNISANGTGFKEPITLAIAAPAAQTFNANTSLFSAQTFNANTSLYDQVSFNANTGVSGNTITPNNQPFSVGDVVLYTTGVGQTAVTGLTNATNYYVVLANSTVVALSATPNGAQIALTKGLTATTGEYLTKYDFLYTAAANPFANGTVLQYTVAAGNTAISPLSNGSNYYVVTSNSVGFALSNTLSGPVINVVPGVSESGHTFTRYSFVSISGSVYQTGDKVTYMVAAGNTAVSPLVTNTVYRVQSANSSGFFVANGFLYKEGQYFTLTPGASETGHSFTGETATGNVTIGGAASGGVTHAGWVIRREGTGGRAGRVTYETLIAMGSLGAQTAQYGTPALVANASGTSNSVFPSSN
jgi:hypothetical protein